MEKKPGFVSSIPVRFVVEDEDGKKWKEEEEGFFFAVSHSLFFFLLRSSSFGTASVSLLLSSLLSESRWQGPWLRLPLERLKKRARKAFEAGGGRERAVFSLSKKNHRPTVIEMSGFLSLLGLAPPPQRPSPARYQSPAREDRPAPEFSLAELRRVHGVLLVSFFLSFSIGSNQSSDGEIQGTPTLTHRRQTSPPPPRPTAS